ncbi:MAG: hypothetical protein ACP5OG_04855 [Candidatus Nanoarchaeia archaeon]
MKKGSRENKDKKYFNKEIKAVLIILAICLGILLVFSIVNHLYNKSQEDSKLGGVLKSLGLFATTDSATSSPYEPTCADYGKSTCGKSPNSCCYDPNTQKCTTNGDKGICTDKCSWGEQACKYGDKQCCYNPKTQMCSIEVINNKGEKGPVCIDKCKEPTASLCENNPTTIDIPKNNFCCYNKNYQKCINNAYSATCVDRCSATEKICKDCCYDPEKQICDFYVSPYCLPKDCSQAGLSECKNNKGTVVCCYNPNTQTCDSENSKCLDKECPNGQKKCANINYPSSFCCYDPSRGDECDFTSGTARCIAHCDLTRGFVCQGKLDSICCNSGTRCSVDSSGTPHCENI